jgi:prevent-host-death family protein
MSHITLEEAQTRLSEVVQQLAPGDEVIITVNQKPVARLLGIAAKGNSPRARPATTGIPKAGAYEGRLTVPEDFDEPLEELREYTE